MKSSVPELITNACFNLERLSRSFRLARISPLERLWNGFDSDAESFPNLMHKLYYYSFKIFPRFWLAKSTRLIHHN